MNSPYLNLLGLAQRAGKCITGEELILKNMRHGKVKLLLLASDISSTTKKKFLDKCSTFQVPYMEVDDRKTLAQAIGKSDRIAIAILDDGFAKKIISMLS